MHLEARQYCESLAQRFPNHFRNRKVAEVGSLNINGTARNLFQGGDYTGIDHTAGRGVDVVGEAREVLQNNIYDVVFSTEALEHDVNWEDTFLSMWVATSKGGLVFFTCATTGRPIHGTHEHRPQDSPATNEYYRNLTEQDFRQTFELEQMFAEHGFVVNAQSHDLYFWGITK